MLTTDQRTSRTAATPGDRQHDADPVAHRRPAPAPSVVGLDRRGRPRGRRIGGRCACDAGLGHGPSLALAATRCQHPPAGTLGRRGADRRRDRGRGRDGDGGRARARLARPRPILLERSGDRTRGGELRRAHAELPAHLPRPVYVRMARRLARALAAARGRRRRGAPPGRGRARPRRRHGHGRRRARGGRRVVRAADGRRGGRAVAAAPPRGAGRGSSTSRRARSSAPTRRSRRRRASDRGRGREIREGNAGRTTPIRRRRGRGRDVRGRRDPGAGGDRRRRRLGAAAPPRRRRPAAARSLRSSSRPYSTTDPDLGAIPTLIDWDAAPDQFALHRAQRVRPRRAQGGDPPVRARPSIPDARTFEPGRGTRGRGRRVGRPPCRPGARAHPSPRPACTPSRPTRTSCSTASGPLVVASPCSGHGFKFAPLVGEVLADLATGRDARRPARTVPAGPAGAPP